MQTHEIRKRFLEHFIKSGHTEVPSASLILDDPNLLFVNAGMVPFKPYFLGQQTPEFSTATSIQKCVRTLDIEEVGITTRHNTFFQMAGNFSWGNYFKEGAIKHAWSLLTGSLEDGGFGIDPDLLWVTVYLDDDEAYAIWRDEVGIPEERIQRRDMADNYWSMGVPGPCGPCSEIFYDRGPEYGVEGGPIADEDRYIEIWNLVFMEKERGEGVGKDGFKIVGDLPKKNIDTGMGIERVAFLLQGVENVYETDLLRPVINTAEKLTGATYGAENKDANADIHFRVIADHSRTALMLILDGVTPGNEGRGYILRRLIRRIIRSARLLGATGDTIGALMDTVRDTMTPSYPEITENFNRIRTTAVNEEKAFLKTLESGTRLFETAADSVVNSGTKVLSGESAFALHDTYGFPIDLTLEMAAERGLTVDREGFKSLMAEQRARAKADSRAKKMAHTDLHIYREFVDNHPTRFTGYTELVDEAKVLGLVSNGELVSSVTPGQAVEVIVDQSPMYAEAGGQMADRGQFTTADGLRVDIEDVQKIGKKLWVHRGTVAEGELAVGANVIASVDEAWRHAARQAHSGTHLIHAALREVLGKTAVQAGSLNKPGYLRFDFTYGAGLTEAQLNEIEAIANGAVDADYAVNTIETTLDEAKAMGAMALFGENYGENVRVVEIGGPFSMELCGGTHVTHSSQIGPIAVLGESSVGSGVRRIEAYSGLDSFKYLSKERALAAGLAASMKAPSEELPDRIAALADKLKHAEKELAELRAKQLLAQADTFINEARTAGDFAVITTQLPESVGSNDMRTLATDIANRVRDRKAVVLLSIAGESKLPFLVAVSKPAIEAGVKAGELVALMGQYVDGRGGGKPAMAQGSGANPAGWNAAIEAVAAELGAK